MNKKYFLCSLLIFSVFSFVACKKNSSTIEPVVKGTASVSGVLKFHDNSLGSYGRIELKSVATNITVFATCDSIGVYSFTELVAGSYVLTFRSTTPEINTTIVSIVLEDKQELVQDIFITYKYLDLFSQKIICDSIIYIKPQVFGVKIGENYDLIDYISGIYYRDYPNEYALSFTAYKIPDNFSWTNPGVEITADYISQNFELLGSFDEQPVKNFNHEIRISGSGLPIFLNPPFNGLALVRKGNEGKKLPIPCEDSANNHFGFIVYYK